MGAAIHRATRVFRMYNIENRVDKVLSKEKPTPSPRYKADQEHFQSSINDSSANNLASETIHRRDEKLLDNLHDVKVYSSGDNPVIRRADEPSGRAGSKLPALNRLEEPLDENSPDGTFGYTEPRRVPPGRVSLRQFLAYLQQHRDGPEEYSVSRFAEMYTIKPDIAERLFKYHSLLALQEVARQQSKAPARPPHVLAAEVLGMESEPMRKPGPETGITTKY